MIPWETSYKKKGKAIMFPFIIMTLRDKLKRKGRILNTIEKEPGKVIIKMGLCTIKNSMNRKEGFRRG